MQGKLKASEYCCPFSVNVYILKISEIFIQMFWFCIDFRSGRCLYRHE